MSEQTPDIETLSEAAATWLESKSEDRAAALLSLCADDFAQALAPVLAAAVREAEQRVADAFVEWAMKNEIAEPPLDWAWFGEIARRYWPHHPDALHHDAAHDGNDERTET